MLTIPKCFTLAIVIATVVVNNLTKNKNPLDFES